MSRGKAGGSPLFPRDQRMRSDPVKPRIQSLIQPIFYLAFSFSSFISSIFIAFSLHREYGEQTSYIPYLYSAHRGQLWTWKTNKCIVECTSKNSSLPNLHRFDKYTPLTTALKIPLTTHLLTPSSLLTSLLPISQSPTPSPTSTSVSFSSITTLEPSFSLSVGVSHFSYGVASLH